MDQQIVVYKPSEKLKMEVKTDGGTFGHHQAHQEYFQGRGIGCKMQCANFALAQDAQLGKL